MLAYATFALIVKWGWPPRLLSRRSGILVVKDVKETILAERVSRVSYVTWRRRSSNTKQTTEERRCSFSCQCANMASASVPLLMDDDTIAFGEEDEAVQNGNKLKHPYVTTFHLAFRIMAIVVYILCELFSHSFIASFVTVVLLLSMDFWTVKNITGRLMVGLRWWNYVDENGMSHWVFESKKGAQQNRINAAEARIFWLALVLCPLMWSLLFIIGLFRFNFKWLLLVCIAIVLNGANLYGYVKCKMGSDQNISTATSDFFRKQVMQNVAGMMTRSPPTNNLSQPTNVI
ncbi:hypothetical protein KM043_011547 [Ampulex compressa]|nr:hypothetical protein KM043_011547 [Ampulex compressa]